MHIERDYLSDKRGYKWLSRLRGIPCSHRCRCNTEFFLQGWSTIHSEYFEAFIEECCMQDGRQPSSVGSKLEPGEFDVLIYFQSASSGFLDHSHQTNLCFSLRRIREFR